MVFLWVYSRNPLLNVLSVHSDSVAPQDASCSGPAENTGASNLQSFPFKLLMTPLEGAD